MSSRPIHPGTWLRTGRRWAGAAKNALLPKPEVAAWRRACRAAESVPRYSAGRIHLLEYDLAYVDLLTLCPQWYDIFVRETHRVVLEDREPRILDCGANVGLTSLYFRSLFPKARVTAFEADPNIADVLSGNLSRNGCSDVEIVRAAAWTSAGSVDFRIEGADSGAVASVAGEMAGQTRAVPSVRLRDFIEREPIDILKLDIEGAEAAVLEDSADVLRNVRVLLMELHELERSRRRTTQVLAILERAGFTWSLDDLTPLPWRSPVAGGESPFPGTHLCWALLVRGWRAPDVAR